ncbi:hypothetical protein BZG20_05785 [Salinivibrio sp. IB868]|uniref:LysR family transcriptional regulator n=1 Tax=unclassified Salinivibrio TaxID=2636825 RepID=UPI00098671BB|nr:MULTISPECIES: LysR family transcriptional regulator [unclassified Salinivibrio]OOE67532.1 hypothetical protein BZG20_05785 [Salinivibrio sp. IB868]OOE71872.1 hypothetical protein BZG22_14675 [Salinivibrio sp. IB870]
MDNVERLFLRVVETGSFKRAAEQLNQEPSSISRKIAALEDRLKVKLLRRSTQRTTPTELGQRYYERMRHIVDEQTELEEEIRSGVNRLSGTLRIAAPVDFGTRFVVPVARQMQQQSDDLNIELLLGSQFDNLQERSIDVAVRIGNLPDSSLVARKLGDVPRVLVASPDYLKVHGEPETIDDLEQHNFVQYSPETRRSDIKFEDGQYFPHTKIHSNITVNSVEAIRELVLANVGIHLGPEWIFKNDLSSGRVVRLLPDYRLSSFPVHAVYLARSYLPFKTREFTRLLADSL